MQNEVAKPDELFVHGIAIAMMTKFQISSLAVSASLSIHRPETIENFVLLGKMLECAYKAGQQNLTLDQIEASIEQSPA